MAVRHSGSQLGQVARRNARTAQEGLLQWAGPSNDIREMAVPKLYVLANCDTCRRAVKWLRAQGIAFEERAIRETPPSGAELRRALAACDGQIGRICNTSGREYRAEKLGERLPGMTAAAALELLAANGNLVKRPFLVGDDFVLMGFNEAAWTAALVKR